MLSNGGLTNVDEAKRRPVQLLESGPAAGALAAAHFGRDDGDGNVLAFDMGGTTAKLSVVDEGKPLVAYSFEAARQKRFMEGSGLPIRISTLELIEIGAGGGSIARLDEIGLMKVGPESAGSEPGPAAYGLGGSRPTVTDADFLLGYLNPDFFAGGSMAIDMGGCREAIAGLAAESGLTPEQTAWGIHDVVNENMASAARVHIAERGKDPRRYSLLATGGAGPVHAYYVAKKLGLRQVICPPAAGVASALGLLIAPARIDRVATIATEMNKLDWTAFEDAYGRLEREANEIVAETGLDAASATVQRLADIRYVGQAFEVVVELPPGPYTAASSAALTEAFERSYLEKFTRTPPAVPVEIINIRVTVTAEVAGTDVSMEAAEASDRPALKGRRSAFFPEFGEHVETPVYDRLALRPGEELEGPAILEERESTFIVGPGARFRVAASGNVVVTMPGQEEQPSAGRSAFDAVTLEVIWTRMISAVDEAAKTLQRTSFSTLVNESNDFACVLTDAEGQSLVQNTESIPSFIGSLPVTVKHFIETIGLDNMRPGDFLVTNNPWVATGHLNDVSIAKPIFRGGRIVGFAASTAHVPDIGGKVRSVEAREVFEEGFHIPAMKLIDDGKPDATLFKLLRAAVRTPDQTEGDIWAQVTGLNLMEQRLQDLMGEYGMTNLAGFASEIHGRCERAMREATAQIPDGTYTCEFQTDGFEEPFVYRTAVTIAGDRIHVDYTGTSPQVDRAINCTMTYTFAMSAYALKCALLPALPNNEGIFRCVEVSAPAGTLVNPTFPVAVGGRMATGHYLPTAIFGALADVIPDRVIAPCGSPLWSIIQTGVRPNGKTYANVLFFNGGMGATPQADGQSCLAWPSNVSNVPIELVERNSPLFFHRKAMRPDSGGRGRYRGGLGQDILLESRSDTNIGIIFMAERCKFAAPGLRGGSDGGLGIVEIDGKPADYRVNHVLAKGQTIRLATPGGAGYGSENERSPEARDRDRLRGYVSA